MKGKIETLLFLSAGFLTTFWMSRPPPLSITICLDNLLCIPGCLDNLLCIPECLDNKLFILGRQDLLLCITEFLDNLLCIPGCLNNLMYIPECLDNKLFILGRLDNLLCIPGCTASGVILDVWTAPPVYTWMSGPPPE